jgi:hypothetical protein
VSWFGLRRRTRGLELEAALTFETLANELMEPVGPLRLDRYAGISGLFQEFRRRASRGHGSRVPLCRG